MNLVLHLKGKNSHHQKNQVLFNELTFHLFRPTEKPAQMQPAVITHSSPAAPAPVPAVSTPDMIPVGYKVAALVRKPDEWILAVVTKQLPEKNKYEVTDADDEEEPKKYLIPKAAVIPLPTPDNSAKGFVKTYEFAKDAPVLAIFPNTTCFYKAHVVSVSEKRRRVSFSWILSLGG
jgi:hypothetical protein